MILLEEPVECIIYQFIEDAVSVLDDTNLSLFIDKFDYSCIKKHELYIALRYGSERRKAITIDNPLIVPCHSSQNNIQKIGDGYFLTYGLFSYGRENNIFLKVHFIIDKDMLYTILENIRY